MNKENQALIKALNMYGRVPEMRELLEEIERLNNIINEVREYIESFNLLKNLGALEKDPISISELKHILELLNIGEDNEEN